MVTPPKSPVKYNDVAWTSIWESQRGHICDPMDVPAVLWDIMAEQTNRLSATEIMLLQRRVRQVVAALPKSNTQQLSTHKMMNRFIISTTTKKTNGPTGNTTAAVANSNGGVGAVGGTNATDYDDAVESKTMVEKYHQLDEVLFKRVFSAGDSLKGTLPVIDPLTNLYILATYLSSDYLWERTSVVARHAAEQAELVLDVNSSSSTTTTAITTSSASLPPPPVSVNDKAHSEPIEVAGANLASIAYLVSLALRKWPSW
jgi:hypothetical protein